MKNFVVSPGYIVEIIPQAPPGLAPGQFSGFSKVETASPKLTASGKSVLIGSLSWVAASCIFPGGVFVAGGGSIAATSTKTTGSGTPILREGDQGTCVGGFTTNGGPVVCNCKMKITAAGQMKAGGE